MNILSNDISEWGESLESFKPEYTAIKVWNLTQLYCLSGRKTTLLIDNFEPIEDLKYCLYSPAEKRYYLKTYPSDIPLWLIMFYNPNGSWDSYDTFLNSLRARIEDKNVYILLTQKQIDDTTSMLIRLYKSHFNGTGKVPYKTYLKLLDQSLRLENYKSYGANLTGFKTVCKQFEDRINELWNSCLKN